MAERVLEAYFIPGGKPRDQAYVQTPMACLNLAREFTDLVIVANFVEVFLAKEDHDGLVGINYMEKVQLPSLPALLGAMLARVDVVLMGAGIPLSIPGVLDGLANWEPVSLRLQVENDALGQGHTLSFDPGRVASGECPNLNRPEFLAVVSSDVVAKSLLRKANGRVQGFVVENHTAGGHNAPPRSKCHHQDPPVREYGSRDVPDLAKIKALNRPFWLAGGYASPDRLKEARQAGAEGIQVGTAFAFCTESGILNWIKQAVIERQMKGTLKVLTDFQASPTGFPFKRIRLFPPAGQDQDRSKRKRICDLGHLRRLYWETKSQLGFRCPSEPVSAFVAKGGSRQETEGKRCLCNGLLATIGLGQPEGRAQELPIITAGADFSFLSRVLDRSRMSYSVRDVLGYLLGKSEESGDSPRMQASAETAAGPA
jgi:nitronate monooxygenase